MQNPSKPTFDVVVTNPDLPDFGMPSYGTVGSAAVDLRAMFDEPQITLASGQTMMIDSGIKLHIGDPAYAALMLPRSGTGSRGLVLANLVGLIDSDYQGPLKINLWNRSDKPQTILRGERVAQLVIVPVVQFDLNIVADFVERTERGEGGYGSTGVK